MHIARVYQVYIVQKGAPDAGKGLLGMAKTWHSPGRGHLGSAPGFDFA